MSSDDSDWRTAMASQVSHASRGINGRSRKAEDLNHAVVSDADSPYVTAESSSQSRVESSTSNSPPLVNNRRRRENLRAASRGCPNLTRTWTVDNLPTHSRAQRLQMAQIESLRAQVDALRGPPKDVAYSTPVSVAVPERRPSVYRARDVDESVRCCWTWGTQACQESVIPRTNSCALHTEMKLDLTGRNASRNRCPHCQIDLKQLARKDFDTMMRFVTSQIARDSVDMKNLARQLLSTYMLHDHLGACAVTLAREQADAEVVEEAVASETTASSSDTVPAFDLQRAPPEEGPIWQARSANEQTSDFLSLIKAFNFRHYTGDLPPNTHVKGPRANMFGSSPDTEIDWALTVHVGINCSFSHKDPKWDPPPVGPLGRVPIGGNTPCHGVPYYADIDHQWIACLRFVSSFDIRTKRAPRPGAPLTDRSGPIKAQSAYLKDPDSHIVELFNGENLAYHADPAWLDCDRNYTLVNRVGLWYLYKREKGANVYSRKTHCKYAEFRYLPDLPGAAYMSMAKAEGMGIPLVHVGAFAKEGSNTALQSTTGVNCNNHVSSVCSYFKNREHDWQSDADGVIKAPLCVVEMFNKMVYDTALFCAFAHKRPVTASYSAAASAHLMSEIDLKCLRQQKDIKGVAIAAGSRFAAQAVIGAVSRASSFIKSKFELPELEISVREERLDLYNHDERAHRASLRFPVLYSIGDSDGSSDEQGPPILNYPGPTTPPHVPPSCDEVGETDWDLCVDIDGSTMTNASSKCPRAMLQNAARSAWTTAREVAGFVVVGAEDFHRGWKHFRPPGSLITHTGGEVTSPDITSLESAAKAELLGKFEVSSTCDGQRTFNPWGSPARRTLDVLRYVGDAVVLSEGCTFSQIFLAPDLPPPFTVKPTMFDRLTVVRSLTGVAFDWRKSTLVEQRDYLHRLAVEACNSIVNVNPTGANVLKPLLYDANRGVPRVPSSYSMFGSMVKRVLDVEASEHRLADNHLAQYATTMSLAVTFCEKFGLHEGMIELYGDREFVEALRSPFGPRGRQAYQTLDAANENVKDLLTEELRAAYDVFMKCECLPNKQGRTIVSLPPGTQVNFSATVDAITKVFHKIFDGKKVFDDGMQSNLKFLWQSARRSDELASFIESLRDSKCDGLAISGDDSAMFSRRYTCDDSGVVHEGELMCQGADFSAYDAHMSPIMFNACCYILRKIGCPAQLVTMLMMSVYTPWYAKIGKKEGTPESEAYLFNTPPALATGIAATALFGTLSNGITQVGGRWSGNLVGTARDLKFALVVEPACPASYGVMLKTMCFDTGAGCVMLPVPGQALKLFKTLLSENEMRLGVMVPHLTEDYVYASDEDLLYTPASKSVRNKLSEFELLKVVYSSLLKTVSHMRKMPLWRAFFQNQHLQTTNNLVIKEEHLDKTAPYKSSYSNKLRALMEFGTDVQDQYADMIETVYGVGRSELDELEEFIRSRREFCSFTSPTCDKLAAESYATPYRLHYYPRRYYNAKTATFRANPFSPFTLPGWQFSPEACSHKKLGQSTTLKRDRVDPSLPWRSKRWVDAITSNDIQRVEQLEAEAFARCVEVIPPHLVFSCDDYSWDSTFPNGGTEDP